ncbi:MAG: hypothetical protein KJ970_08580 [Candidatus Eisenbacteria bacterium]|uniref:YCII-related domain-containing protein n=1 Tax=Eiseniibacteriota bacterium TaxID=2212470 RepID=A0A948W6T5_UNCEI|nr:hypothetical protein [Candidatus Eisenbacteria bacterium]MBU1948661.1 hypothetical protein [Candidatus Eisenbacteria bacterium]MBU2690971.1 hypothetical protein [Candidatus Eisenbacteria bacterium]
MQFIVIAYDGTDDQALERRLASREIHLEQAKEMFKSGKWLYAAGILDDGGKMVGSMIICDFPSRAELQEEWLNHEPYVIGDVWDRIEINRAQVPPFLMK